MSNEQPVGPLLIMKVRKSRYARLADEAREHGRLELEDASQSPAFSQQRLLHEKAASALFELANQYVLLSALYQNLEQEATRK